MILNPESCAFCHINHPYGHVCPWEQRATLNMYIALAFGNLYRITHRILTQSVSYGN